MAPNLTWSQRARGLASRLAGALRSDSVDDVAPSSPSSSMRNDGYYNRTTGHGTGRDKRTHTRYRQGKIITDLEARDLWRTNDLTARIVETKASEAMRRGYQMKAQDKAVSERVMKACEDLHVDETITHAMHMREAYGGSAIFPVLDTVDDLSTPLQKNRIAAVHALHTLEPRELSPISYYRDLNNQKFGQPEVYRLVPINNGVIQANVTYVHESRLVVLRGARVTREIMPGQRPGWDDSCLIRPDEVLADYGIAWQSAAALLNEFASGTLSMDKLAELAAREDGDKVIEKRLSAMDIAASTIKMRVIDGKDKYERQQTPITGLAELLIQFAQRVAAAADMPLTILMGMSPSGLNATGDMDIRSWYDRIQVVQKRMRRYIVQLLELVMLSTTGPTNGKLLDQWSIEFNPLWQPSSLETAQERKVIAETDEINIRSTVYSATDAAESHYKGDTYSPDIVIDWVARKAAEDARAIAAVDLTEEDIGAMTGADGEPDATDPGEGDEGEPVDDTEVSPDAPPDGNDAPKPKASPAAAAPAPGPDGRVRVGEHFRKPAARRAG